MRARRQRLSASGSSAEGSHTSSARRCPMVSIGSNSRISKGAWNTTRRMTRKSTAKHLPAKDDANDRNGASLFAPDQCEATSWASIQGSKRPKGMETRAPSNLPGLCWMMKVVQLIASIAPMPNPSVHPVVAPAPGRRTASTRPMRAMIRVIEVVTTNAMAIVETRSSAPIVSATLAVKFTV